MGHAIFSLRRSSIDAFETCTRPFLAKGGALSTSWETGVETASCFSIMVQNCQEHSQLGRSGQSSCSETREVAFPTNFEREISLYLSWELITRRAAQYRHVDFLEWSFADELGRLRWTWWFLAATAARNGQLHVLQWMHSKLDHSWIQVMDIGNSAAEGGQLEVLQWADAYGHPWDEYTCATAALDGHLEVIQYAYANGCPWDEKSCAHAAFWDHLEVLQWALENGCPWDKRTWYDCRDPDMKEWLIANNCPEGP